MTLNSKYFSLTQVAEMKGMTSAHLRKMILLGKIKGEKVGNSWLIEKKQLDKIHRQRRFLKKKDV